MLLRKIEDVAKEVNVSASTIKKYYLLVEKHGYRFARNNQGHLLFSDQDIQLFRKIIYLKNEPGVKVEDAIGKVISSITAITVPKEEDITDITDIKDITPELQEIKKIVLQQTKIIEEQQKQINSLVEGQRNQQNLLESDVSRRDKLLMESLKETRELKQMIIEAQKKKWWKKLF